MKSSFQADFFFNCNIFYAFVLILVKLIGASQKKMLFYKKKARKKLKIFTRQNENHFLIGFLTEYALIYFFYFFAEAQSNACAAMLVPRYLCRDACSAMLIPGSTSEPDESPSIFFLMEDKNQRI